MKSGLTKLVFRLSSFLSFLSPSLRLSLCSEARGSWGIRWCVTTCQSGDGGPVPQQRGCVRVRVCVHVGGWCVCVRDSAALNDRSVGELGAPRGRPRLLLRRNTFTQEAH